MSEKQYIDKVKATLESHADSSEKVVEIAGFSPPEHANPLIVLIHGDSQQLQWKINYAKDHDQDPYSDEEIKQLATEVAEATILKIKNYVLDWEDENYYSYVFTLNAGYGAFVNNTPQQEYLYLSRKLDVKTVHEAVAQAKEWEERLLERVNFYHEQKVGHKLLGVTPHYTIRDKNYLKIASGSLNFGNEEGISTWVNQD